MENIDHVGAIGKAGYGWETQIVDENRNPVPKGAVGGLAVRGAGVMCCFSLSAFAQKLSVKGTVVDETGAPLIGASVVVMSGEKIIGGGYNYRYIR